MAINFPASPTSGDNHTVGNKSWQWDGEKWNTKGTFVSPSILKVDRTNSRVGIGTTSPTETLHINGSIKNDSWAYLGSVNSSGLYPDAGTHLAVGWNETGGGRDITFWNTDTAGGGTSFQFNQLTGASTDENLFTIRSNGRIGIGTSNPTGPLHLHAAGDGVDQLKISSTGGTTAEYGFLGASAAGDYMRYGYWTGAGFGSHFFEGNVGIGTTTPDEALEVVGSIHIPSGSNVWIGNNANSGERFRMHHSGTNSYVDYASGDVLFRANGTSTTLTLKAGGKVGIGTTAPVRRLTVESDLCVATGNTAYLWQTNTVNTNLQLWSKTASGDTGWGQRVYMTQSATSWAAGSDRRIKRDIVDHDGDLAEILNLRVRSYNFNDDAADQPTRYGFITDEVPASLGHLVTGEAGAVTIDEETGEEKPDPQGLFYTDLVPHLVGAIQELSAQNASLVARIETLETA